MTVDGHKSMLGHKLACKKCDRDAPLDRNYPM
ncbi:hypothetical protein [Paraglaciecola psychrophila]